MKNSLKLTLILLLTFNFGLLTSQAQTPNEFKYQAVLRNADGTIIAEENVQVDISILQGSAGGTIVFDETHNVTTTAQGLINLNIGSESNLSVVDFSSNTYFIEISVNSTVMGTSQLLSVPYALMAKNVENDSVGDGSETKITAGANVTVSGTGTTTNPYVINATGGSATIHYVGELIGTNGEDGIVFYIDGTGEHGLICSKTDINSGSGVQWSNITNMAIGSSARSQFNGVQNTTAIIGQNGHTNSAAKLCVNYSTTGTSAGDWYLPSIDELSQIYYNKYQINKALNLNSFGFTYWSSTEYQSGHAWARYFYDGASTYLNNKSNLYRVRAIRAF